MSGEGKVGAKLTTWFEKARMGLQPDRGQTLVEYALIVGFIGMATIAAMVALGPAIGHAFEMVTKVITDHTVL